MTHLVLRKDLTSSDMHNITELLVSSTPLYSCGEIDTLISEPRHKTILNYALLPHTALLQGNMGYLCTGWDAFAPRFIMTEKYFEMLEYLKKGRRVNITIPVQDDMAMTIDLLYVVDRAARNAAAKSNKNAHLYYYTYDDTVGNFRKEQII